MTSEKQKLALVIGSLPTIEEIDQFKLIAEAFEIHVISSESICGYLSQNSFFQNLTCVILRDHDENPSFLPGLEQSLEPFDIVVVKERLGLYTYQTLKAKWRHSFRLLVLMDNLNPFPSQDVDQMRTIRQEVTRAADGFLVHSRAAESMLQLEGVEADRIHYLKPWVEKRFDRKPSLREEARRRLGLADSDLIISYLGQVEWEEGLKELVGAARLLVDREPTIKERLKIVVCGIGSYAPELRETFQTYGLEECSAYYAPTRESISAIIQATDAMYLATLPSRDRIEGDPYRILMPMTYGIPVIAPRNPLIEEFCGKHRLDFCPYSPQSLAKALRKLRQSPGLVKDIVEKNLGEVKKRFDQSKIQNDMMEFFKRFAAADPKVDKSSLDYQVLEIEAKIKNKQYLDAIELIESVFQIKDVPLHHRANLYRLVGDCFAKLGDLESAKDAYLQGADLDPYSAKIYIGLGTVGLMKNTADTAVLQFQRAVSLAPEDEMANLGLGLSFQGMGEHREAWRWVKKALQLNPENTAAIFSFVKLAHELEEYSDCEAALQRFLERHPRDINMKYTLGGLVFKQDRFNEVIRLMDEILEQDENDNRALALRKQAKDAIDNEQASSSNG